MVGEAQTSWTPLALMSAAVVRGSGGGVSAELCCTGVPVGASGCTGEKHSEDEEEDGEPSLAASMCA